MSSPQEYDPTLTPSQADAAGYAPRASDGLPTQRHVVDESHTAPSAPEIDVHLLLVDRKAQGLDVGPEVARGGMGAVLAAKESATRRTVAMKVMLRGADERDALRFIEEAQVTAQLEHPNIVPVHDLGLDAQGQPFYTMKLVGGTTLKDVIERLKTGEAATLALYPLATLLTVFQKVCDALAFAHSRGVVHRDLKPANLMIGEFGEVLVMDWGLAKILRRDGASAAITSARGDHTGADGSHTLAGSVVGTPHYMSPEQARGENDTLDARSDIFTLGVILYELLTLQRPFEGRNVAEIMRKIVGGDFVPPAQRTVQGVRMPSSRPTSEADLLAGGSEEQTFPASAQRTRRSRSLVPESLDAIVRKAMAIDPVARYADVAALQTDLAAYQRGFITSAEGSTAWKQIKALIRRNKAASFGLAAVLLVGTVLGSKAILEGRRAERALAELRGTAPTFYEQAQALRDAGTFDEAIRKLGFALQLDPKNADYRLMRGHLYQAQQRLAAAAVEFQMVLAQRPDDRSARENLALCERLLAENGSEEGPLKREVQARLVDALTSQKRLVEVAPLALALGQGQESVEAALRARLKEFQGQAGWSEGRVSRLRNGTFRVSLHNLQVTDVSMLHGLPVTELNLDGSGITDLASLRGLQLHALSLMDCPVRDLSPLAGMPLRDLNLRASQVVDLAPLKGLPIESLDLFHTAVRELTPLAGAPLHTLTLTASQVRDLTPLAGMPLRSLKAAFADYVDFSPLAGCREMEEVFTHLVSVDLPIFDQWPKLRRIEVERNVSHTLAELRTAHGPTLEAFAKIRAFLRAQRPPLEGSRCGMTDEGIELNLRESNVRDLSPLRGLPIARLHVGRTEVTDLSPLRGMPLKMLSASSCPVTDISPLLEMPLLDRAQVPINATNLDLLRQHPTLKYLGYIPADWMGNLSSGRPILTVAEFWTRHEQFKAAGLESIRDTLKTGAGARELLDAFRSGKWPPATPAPPRP